MSAGTRNPGRKYKHAHFLPFQVTAVMGGKREEAFGSQKVLENMS